MCIFLKLKYLKLSKFFKAKCVILKIIKKISEKEGFEHDNSKLLTLYTTLTKMKLSRKEYYLLLNNFETLEDINFFKDLHKKIVAFGLQRYLDTEKLVRLILTKRKSIEFYIEVAKDFDNFHLDENELADYGKLLNLYDITEEEIREIINVMINTKNKGYPLSLKKIIKYYDADKKYTKNLKDLEEAWILAHKFQIPVTINDFIKVARNGRELKKFITNYLIIKKFDIPISLEEFIAFTYDQNKITDFLKNLGAALSNNIDIDVETILNKLYLNAPVDIILKYLVKFAKANINIDYNKLETFYKVSKDLDELFNAYNYNKEHNIIEEDPFNYFYYLKYALGDDVKLVNFLKALQKGFSYFKKEKNEDNEENEKQEIIDKIFRDYIKGIDVFSILNQITFAQSKGLDIPYNKAVLFSKHQLGLKNIIHYSLNPVILDCPHDFSVHTKDYIEVVLKIQIEATLILDNLFFGTDIDVICERIYAHLTAEIQNLEYKGLVSKINEILHKIVKELPEDEIVQKINGEEKRNKLIKISKWYPHKILIPKIEFVKDTFKEIDKMEKQFHLHHKLEELELRLKEAEVRIKEAWASGNNVKYLILKDEPLTSSHHNSHSSHSSDAHSAQSKSSEKNKNDDHKEDNHQSHH